MLPYLRAVYLTVKGRYYSLGDLKQPGKDISIVSIETALLSYCHDERY